MCNTVCSRATHSLLHAWRHTHTPRRQRLLLELRERSNTHCTIHILWYLPFVQGFCATHEVRVCSNCGSTRYKADAIIHLEAHNGVQKACECGRCANAADVRRLPSLNPAGLPPCLSRFRDEGRETNARPMLTPRQLSNVASTPRCVPTAANEANEGCARNHGLGELLGDCWRASNLLCIVMSVCASSQSDGRQRRRDAPDNATSHSIARSKL